MLWTHWLVFLLINPWMHRWEMGRHDLRCGTRPDISGRWRCDMMWHIAHHCTFSDDDIEIVLCLRRNWWCTSWDLAERRTAPASVFCIPSGYSVSRDSTIILPHVLLTCGFCVWMSLPIWDRSGRWIARHIGKKNTQSCFKTLAWITADGTVTAPHHTTYKEPRCEIFIVSWKEVWCAHAARPQVDEGGKWDAKACVVRSLEKIGTVMVLEHFKVPY